MEKTVKTKLRQNCKHFLTRMILLAAALVALLLPATSHAQNYLYEVGQPTFSTSFPVENGFVNIANGNLHLEIPLGSALLQRGGLSYMPKLVYDSRIWQFGNGSGYAWAPTNVPNSEGGWRVENPLGTMVISTNDSYCAGGANGPPPSGSNVTGYYFIWTDPAGTQHQFNAATMQSGPICQGTEPDK